jgi:2-keto-4-pentenoate hydratase/2-oxohepta-3-ene-1,7-dioic acid hydratase in catechol pathway
MEAGPLYVHVRRRNHVAGVNLGVDLSLRDLKQPMLLMRALFAGAPALQRRAAAQGWWPEAGAAHACVWSRWLAGC